MITLDVSTILFTNFIISIACTVVVILLWVEYRKTYNGLIFWVVDFILQMIASVLIALRGIIPNLLSIVLANMLIMLGLIFFLMGLEKFFEKKSSHLYNYIFVILFTTIHSYFTFVEPNMLARNINTSIGISFFCIQTFWLLFKRLNLPLHNLVRGIAIAISCYICIILIRLMYIILGYAPNNDLFNLGNFDAIIIFCYMLISFVLAYNLTLMVTKKISLEAKLSEEKFTKVFNLSPAMVIITCKRDEKILEINPAFEKITGYMRNEALGKTTADLNIWVNTQDHEKLLEELTANRKISNYELSFRKKNGELIQTLYFGEIIQTNNESCILANIIDITQLKKNELILKQTKQELENTLEDFYTLRLGMSANLLKNQIDLENESIRKRIDELKNSI
jgi:PAS domain S-box-containing protein